ncbi:MAG: DUF202 domain-containing protein [Verrucomicrobia bacterium]|nr:DUF202 domain-containing protein [Verrucomicrobiota bacterium]
MTQNPYERFEKSELILRDELAIDRTLLANERTVLSYLRGSLTLIIAGVTFVHFVDHGTLYCVGLALMPIGLISGLWGTLRYRRMDGHIRGIRRNMLEKESARLPRS